MSREVWLQARGPAYHHHGPQGGALWGDAKLSLEGQGGTGK